MMQSGYLRDASYCRFNDIMSSASSPSGDPVHELRGPNPCCPPMLPKFRSSVPRAPVEQAATTDQQDLVLVVQNTFLQAKSPANAQMHRSHSDSEVDSCASEKLLASSEDKLFIVHDSSSNGTVAEVNPADLVEYPSLGSAAHESGSCRPCCFFDRGICRLGAECKHCHYLHPGSLKRKGKKGRARQRARLERERLAIEEGDSEPCWQEAPSAGQRISLLAALEPQRPGPAPTGVHQRLDPAHAHGSRHEIRSRFSL
jgi:hypothetical protein